MKGVMESGDIVYSKAEAIKEAKFYLNHHKDREEVVVFKYPTSRTRYCDLLELEIWFVVGYENRDKLSNYVRVPRSE